MSTKNSQNRIPLKNYYSEKIGPLYDSEKI